jgi:hypothetical protein
MFNFFKKYKSEYSEFKENMTELDVCKYKIKHFILKLPNNNDKKYFLNEMEIIFKDKDFNYDPYEYIFNWMKYRSQSTITPKDIIMPYFVKYIIPSIYNMNNIIM